MSDSRLSTKSKCLLSLASKVLIWDQTALSCQFGKESKTWCTTELTLNELSQGDLALRPWPNWPSCMEAKWQRKFVLTALKTPEAAAPAAPFFYFSIVSSFYWWQPSYPAVLLLHHTCWRHMLLSWKTLVNTFWMSEGSILVLGGTKRRIFFLFILMKQNSALIIRSLNAYSSFHVR